VFGRCVQAWQLIVNTVLCSGWPVACAATSVDTYLTTWRVAGCVGASLRSDLIHHHSGRCQHRSEPGQPSVLIAWPPPDRLRLQTPPHRRAGLQTDPPRPLDAHFGSIRETPGWRWNLTLDVPPTGGEV